MGLLVNGEWKNQGYDTEEHGGRFVRWDSAFRHWITRDGGPGPQGQKGYPAAAGRYHLYAANACPWAHRAIIFRTLKGLEDVVGLSVTGTDMLENGWPFDEAHPDHLYGSDYLYELYQRAKPDYSGRVTTPTLWDRETETIVSNESSEIIRMFNTSFEAFSDNHHDDYPEPLRQEIDAVNERVYETVNNGVYRAGFATSQEAYEEALKPLFESLDWLESLLEDRRYLTGERVTEADWRLWTTLIRFDSVYHGHFKCNVRRIVDYPNLWGFTRELYQWPGIRDTVVLDEIRRHYYYSHRDINPTQVVAAGPWLDLDRPHGRG